MEWLTNLTDSLHGAEYLLILLGILIPIVLVILLYFVIPARMARKRGRSVAASILLGLVASPLIVILVLLIIGEK